MSLLEIMWWLLASHFIFDWGLQNRWMADNKSKYWEILSAHCMIYTGGITIILKVLGLFELWQVPFLFATHFFTDWVSSNLSKNVTPLRMRVILWVDHLLHFLCLGYLLF